MREVRIRRAGAFAGAVTLVALYSLRGGAYDVVVRGEYAVGILWILALGLAFGLLPARRPAWRALAPFGAFGLLLLLTALALGWTSSQELTGTEVARVLHHAAAYALPLMVLSRRTWTAAAAGLVAGVLGLAALALLSRLYPGLVGTDVVARALRLERLSYPLGYWNALGAWAATGVALGVAWSAHARQRAVRGLVLAAVPVAVACGYLTYSRAAIASAVVGVLAVVLLARHRLVVLLHGAVAAAGGLAAIVAIRSEPAIARGTGSGGAATVVVALAVAAVVCGGVAALTRTQGPSLEARLPRPLLRGAGAVALLTTVVLAVAIGPRLVSRAYASFSRTANPNSGAAGYRADPSRRLATLSGTRRPVWKASLAAYRAEPSHGIGPGTFGFWWNQRGTDGEVLRDAHSIYLENLAELGWPGLVSILAMLGTLAWAALSPRATVRTGREVGAIAGVGGTLAIFGVSAGVDWMWESTANAALALGSAGVAAAALGRPRVRGRFAIPLRLVLAAAALVALLAQLPSAVATSTVRASQAAVRRGDLEAAYSHAQDAVDVEPWAATPYVQRGLVLEQEGRLAAARIDIERARSHEPQNWTHPLLLARIDAELGRPKAALRAFAEARRLRPRSPIFARLPPPPSGR